MLLVCLAIFIVVLAYRGLSGLASRPRYPKAQPTTVRYIGRPAGTGPQVLEVSPVVEEPLAPEESPVPEEAPIQEEPPVPEQADVAEQPAAVEGLFETEQPSRDVAGMERPMPRKPHVFPSTLATELLSRAADEDAEAIRTIARELVDYSLARGSGSSVRPEVLENLAVQFGVLEMAVRKASTGPGGEPRAIPEDLRSDLFREAFRFLASRAKR
jgi:hypothetical protein